MSTKSNKGFTLVELLIVAPMVILVIGTLIGAIIAMTGNVLATRGASVLQYNIQDALDRIESDVRISGGFLVTNSVTPVVSPQGKNNTGTAFDSATALILNSYATTDNPASATRNIIYKDNLPNACGSGLVNKNPPLVMNVVYFVDSSKTLWRRIVVPATYKGCNALTKVNNISPWQQSSCNIPTGSDPCMARDVRLVDGVTSFQMVYTIPPYTGSAILPTAIQATQNTSVKVTITAAGSAAGKTFTESGTIRAVSPNNYFTI